MALEGSSSRRPNSVERDAQLMAGNHLQVESACHMTYISLNLNIVLHINQPRGTSSVLYSTSARYSGMLKCFCNYIIIVSDVFISRTVPFTRLFVPVG